ncbi:MAG: hypothetical protein QMC95_04535 [Desulfitobacteriaceae bacterium]|nr:hypothetical protein [Desulfitobacteriaceae bacterium]MDI6913468.1 hypothetical protein [Desulfitobacteriaceae bacterium]
MPKHNVIIVREQDEMVAACCVPLEGQFIRELGKGDPFSFQHLEIKTAGDLYRKLIEEFPDQVEVIMVDPRNPLYLIPKLTKETFNNKISFFQALKTIFLYRTPAVIYDGELLSSGQKEFDQSLLDTIRKRIESS